MVFTAWPFPAFLLIVFFVYWSVSSDGFRRWWLLVASYVFYGAWDWRFLGLIWLSTAVDFVAARRMSSDVGPSARRNWLLASLVTNLGVLGFFKYFDFFAGSLQALADRAGIALSSPTLEIVLPVGISFYTFQTLSYTIDVYRKRLEPVSSVRDFALFVAFFPQLVAGPIVRASDFLPQLARARRWSDVDWRRAWTLILIGFIKKACLADHFGVAIDPIFAEPALYSAPTLFMAACLYAGQIFCDFSGYSDIAIGTALLFGYRLPNNFSAPYTACSVIEFWRRWHISLSTWLRDYLYVPLGGNQCSIRRRDFNLLLTMLLGGLWHGAGWNFVAWGALHGLALIACRHWHDSGRRLNFAPAWLLTMVWVVVCWVPFRSPDWETTQDFVRSCLENEGAYSVTPKWWVLLGIAWALQVAGRFIDVERWIRAAPGWLLAILAGAGWAVALSFAQTTATPFIYFQF